MYAGSRASDDSSTGRRCRADGAGGCGCLGEDRLQLVRGLRDLLLLQHERVACFMPFVDVK